MPVRLRSTRDLGEPVADASRHQAGQPESERGKWDEEQDYHEQRDHPPEDVLHRNVGCDPAHPP